MELLACDADTGFAVYSFSLLVALLTMGALGPRRAKPAILLSLVLVGVSMVIFAQAQGLADLLWARSLQGIATGTATSAVGAAMLDLDRENGTLINTLSPLLGMAAGILGPVNMPRDTRWRFKMFSGLC